MVQLRRLDGEVKPKGVKSRSGERVSVDKDPSRERLDI